MLLAVLKALAWLAACLEMGFTQHAHNDAADLEQGVSDAAKTLHTWMFLQYFHRVVLTYPEGMVGFVMLQPWHIV